MAILPNEQVRMRLRCWSIQHGFSERAAELDELVKTVSSAIDTLRHSKALPVVFGALLSLGNHMNGGTPRGQVMLPCSAPVAKVVI